MIALWQVLALAIGLFSLGLGVVFSRRHPLLILCGLELCFNGANVALVAMARYDAAWAKGQLYSLFVILIATCETALILAIALGLWRLRGRAPMAW